MNETVVKRNLSSNVAYFLLKTQVKISGSDQRTNQDPAEGFFTDKHFKFFFLFFFKAGSSKAANANDEDDLIAALKRAREKQVRDAPPDIK